MPTMDRSQTLLTTRIIAAGITLGPLIFLGVVFALHARSDEFGHSEMGNLLSMVSLAPAVFAIVMFPIVPRIVSSNAQEPMAAFRSLVIVRLALFEGAALFGTVAFMLEGKDSAIGAGVALAMVVCLVAQFPTEARLDQWLASQDT